MSGKKSEMSECTEERRAEKVRLDTDTDRQTGGKRRTQTGEKEEETEKERVDGRMDGRNKCASSETLSRCINANSPPSLLLRTVSAALAASAQKMHLEEQSKF